MVIGAITSFFAMGFPGKVIAVFALWRSTQRADIDSKDRTDFVVLAASPLSASLNPDDASSTEDK